MNDPLQSDPITNVLENLYLPRWQGVQWTLPGRWGLRIPDGFVCMYVVTRGGGWFLPEHPQSAPVRLFSGDHLITTSGHGHQVLRDLHCEGEPVADRLIDPGYPLQCDGNTTELLYAQFELGNLSVNPLSSALPELVRLNHRRDTDLKICLQLLDTLHSVRCAMNDGWQLVVRKLAEIIFVQTIAAELTRSTRLASPNNDGGLLHAVTDGVIGPVIKSVLESPEYPWTVPKLARIAKVSKSAFSERFRNLVGMPPLQYVTELRMQKACQLLRESRVEIAKIATLVGYESPSSFSNAFKRWYGSSPVDCRRKATLPQPGRKMAATRSNQSSEVAATDSS